MADEKTVIFTLRVFDGGHESMAQELQNIAQACSTAAHNARSTGGARRAGKVLGEGAVEIAEYEYDPIASA